jgi:hypothetical protein
MGVLQEALTLRHLREAGNGLDVYQVFHYHIFLVNLIALARPPTCLANILRLNSQTFRCILFCGEPCGQNTGWLDGEKIA